MNAPRILIHAPNWIGDQILAYPFYFALRREFPKSRISVIARNWVSKIQFANLIDEVLVDDSTLLPKLKQEKWDMAFALPNSFSSAWKIRQSKASQRVGYRGDFLRSFLLTGALRPAEGHRSHLYLALLAAVLGRDLDPFETTAEALKNFTPELAWKSSAEINLPKGNYWVLAPGSQAESRRWDRDSFLALAQMIYEKSAMPGYIVGGEAERPIAHYLASRRDSGLIDYCAQYSLADLPLLFRGAKFSVSNDSGLAHISSLCGTPSHIVWGAGNPSHTKPIGLGPVTIHSTNPSCWPCEKNKCGNSGKDHLLCLKTQSPAKIFSALEALLS